MHDVVGFMMYRDYIEYFSYLSKEEKADLLDAIFAYVFKGEGPSSLSPVASLAFAIVRNNVDRDLEKYDKKCEKNRKNGALGGRPRKDEGEGREEPRLDKKDEGEVSCVMSEVTEEQFSEFFAEYPKKADEKGARAAFVKACPDEGEFFSIMDGLRKWKASEAWTKEGGRYVPRAAAWLERREWLSPPDKSRASPPASFMGEGSGSFETDDFFSAGVMRGLAM